MFSKNTIGTKYDRISLNTFAGALLLFLESGTPKRLSRFKIDQPLSFALYGSVAIKFNNNHFFK